MKTSIGYVCLLLGALAISGCGDDSSAGPAEPEATRQDVAGVCQWDFEATVKQGPSAGTSLTGHLILRKTGDTTATGALLTGTDDKGEIQYVKVDASFSAGDDITLTFTLPDGGVIQGTGPMGASFDECAAPFQGAAMGPKAGDTGDWSVTCFFCPNPGPTCSGPMVINPFYSSSRVFMSAGGSCIQTGGTARMGPLFGSLTSAPYGMSFDDSGTLLKTTTISATDFPAGTCRGMVVTNPNGVMSAPTGVCR